MGAALVAALIGIISSGALAVDPPKELRYACALKSNGLLRAASAPSDCNAKRESVVTFSVSSPVVLCVQREGSVRKVPLRDCTRGSGATLTIPSNTAAYFCADASNGGVLRYVSDRAQCRSRETAFVVVNHAPTDISLSSSSVAENQPAATVVGSFTATDPDPGDSHTFSLVSGTGDDDNASFEIAGSTLKTKESFDFETKSSYSIRVRAMDLLGATHEEAFTITVTDVVENQAPTDISLSGSSVAENDPAGTTVGSLSTTDPDAGDTHTYSLVSGTGDTDNASFQIDGSTLKTNAVLDYEAGSSRSVRIQTDDGHGGTFSKSFTITVTNANDPPSDVSLTSASVDENQPSGTTVGSFSAIDQDAGQTYSFSLVPGTGDADNGSFQIDGSTLKTADKFNYESKNSYSIRVRATDSGSPAKSVEKSFTITVNDVNDPPTAVPDSYAGAVGNTQFAIGQSPTGPVVIGTGNVTTRNDSDEDGDSISAVDETVASTGGGTVDVDPDGSFKYLPGLGDKSQSDTFTYHVTDGTATSAGTATVSIANALVWYVDNGPLPSPLGDGRSNAPLESLTALNGTGGSGDADASGDTIFLYRGSGSYAGGLELEAGQKLIGEPEGLTVNNGTTDVALVPAGGSNPSISNATGAGIKLAEGVSVKRVSVATTAGDGITGTNVNNATIGPDLGISGASGADFKLSGGNGTVDFGGSVTNSAGRSIDIQNRSGGAVAVSGPISDTGAGVLLDTNPGTTVAFGGTLTLSTGTSDAFTATGGGTVAVTGSGNQVSTTTGRALRVVSTAIGPNGLNFRSISANGAANGIVLDTTGSSGGLTVTGGGTPGSGGTIQHTAGANGAVAGTGIYLNGTKGVSLSRMQLNDHPNFAIRGTGVNGFRLADSTVSGSNGDDAQNADEGSVYFTNLSGTASFPRDTVQGGLEDNLNVTNTTGSLNLTVGGATAADGTTIGLNSTNSGNDGIFLRPNGSGATMTAAIRNNTFQGARGDMLESNPINGGTMNLTLSDNTMHNTHSNIVSTGGGLSILTTGGNQNATIEDNTITGAVGTSILARSDGTSGSFNGTLSGNAIGSTTAGSGSSTGSGIHVDANQGGDLTVDVASNTVKHFKQNGIHVSSGDCGGSCGVFEVTAQGNTVSNPDNATTSNFNGLFILSGKLTGDSFTGCVDAKNNTLTDSGTGPNAGLNADLRVRQRFATTVELPGYTGANNSNTAVEDYLAGRNTLSSVDATNEVPVGGGFTDGGTGCTQPSF